MPKITIPYPKCRTPSECRREQICFDGWHCAFSNADLLIDIEDQKKADPQDTNNENHRHTTDPVES